VTQNLFNTLTNRWHALGGARRALLIVVVFLLAMALWSWVWPIFYTTRDGLNNIIHFNGRIVWKHRTSPSSDYATAIGPYYQLAFVVCSYTRVSTTEGGYVWQVDFWYLPVLAVLVAVLTIASFVAGRWRERRRNPAAR
jgi:hypothetical protein